MKSGSLQKLEKQLTERIRSSSTSAADLSDLAVDSLKLQLARTVFDIATESENASKLRKILNEEGVAWTSFSHGKLPIKTYMALALSYGYALSFTVTYTGGSGWGYTASVHYEKA